MERQESSTSIALPETIQVFRNLKNAKRFAIDIGGSLTKIAYYSTVPYRRLSYASGQNENVPNDRNVEYTLTESSRLHFVKFETKYIEHCLDFISKNLINSHAEMLGKSIKATGGGAYKYTNIIQEKLGLSVDKEDEMSCLIKGCNFLLKNISDEAFMYHRNGNPEYEFQKAHINIFPYLLVNIGSGVSIMKVESEEKYERIGGTATGGGTFWGLGRLLTKAKGFDELLELAEKGDHRTVDLLVKDIYGGDSTTLGLSGDLIASSFGKVSYNMEKNEEINEADAVRSLLFAISNDIGQLASLYSMIHKLTKVYFGGYFLRNHPLSMHTISYAINYWSQGTVQSLFLRHEGYLGAIGAFLKGTEEWDGEKYSWMENYAGSSGLKFGTILHNNSNFAIHQLELDRWESALTYCPLLKNPDQYIPDTVDLNVDQEAREYWLQCFEDKIDTFVTSATASQPDNGTAMKRAIQFKQKYVKRLHHLKVQPFAYGNLTVRSLLDTIEHYLREFDFPDSFLKQRQTENDQSLTFFKSRIDDLDEMDVKNRYENLIKGFLAGNIFDWGAKAVAEMLETQQFGFEQAISKIPERPWLIDDLDLWVKKMVNGNVYKKIAIFVDNSGADIVLGALPFVREMLKLGTKVILCANTAPALNDVTYNELVILLKKASLICPVIEEAVIAGHLLAMENAQSGPCLDLSRLGKDLTHELESVDLIVLEGMGRAVHTNLDAKFSCDSLKIAVIKNAWLAKRLGGDMFAAICKFEIPQND